MPNDWVPDGATATARPIRRVTGRQIAQLAGVSSATVSRALNGRDDVSEETRRVVEEVARGLGYGRPRSAVAQRQPTGLVGITMPYTHTAYFSAILSGAVEALYDREMRAVLCPTRHEHDREVSLLDRLTHGETDGSLLVLPAESADELRLLTERGVKFVVVDPLHDLDEGIPVVSSANASGANQATQHLLRLGHRRIGVITGPPDGVASQRRLQGYYAALAGAGYMPDPNLVVATDFRGSEGLEAADRLLSLADPPTAIFAFNDALAVAASQVARSRGLRLPADLSVVGFDDTIEAETAYPALTTVRQPLAEMGRMAVSLLMRLLNEEMLESLHVELAAKLVVRESTVHARA